MKLFRVATLFLMTLYIGVGAAVAQTCPPHAHVTGTTQSGNVKTIHCGCNTGYVNFDGRCASRAACVGDAGYQLKFALSDCAAGKRPIMSLSCLKGTGITEKSLACLQGLPGALKNKMAALAKCGLLGTVPLDAAIHCEEINDDCISAALTNHKARVALCQK
jgi:hypothetical protein